MTKGPKDTEFGFRHLLGPLLIFFALIPVGCGVLTSAISRSATFADGFWVGMGLLGLGLVFATGMMLRRR